MKRKLTTVYAICAYIVVLAPAPVFADGAVIYQDRCASCHEAGPVRTALGAADLRAALPSWDAFSATVREGRRVMPAFPESEIPDEDLGSVYVFLGGVLSVPEPGPDDELRPPAAGSSQYELPGRAGKRPLPQRPSGSPIDTQRLPLPSATPQAKIDYNAKCRSCHSDLEKPEPYAWFVGGGPNMPRTDFPNLRHMNMEFRDFRLIMEKGGKGMPVFEEFADRSAQGAGFALFKYIRDHAEPDPKPRLACNAEQGEWPTGAWAAMIWVRSCSRCHGRDHEGDTPPGRSGPIRPLTEFADPRRGTRADRRRVGQWILDGHPASLPRNAPRFPHFAASDVEALYARIAVRAWGVEEPERRTPEHDIFWRGEACHAQRCGALKDAADDVAWNAKRAGDKRPISGTKACAAAVRKNRHAVGRGKKVCIADEEIGAYIIDCGPYVPPVRVTTQP